ncbi:hypothetical protein L6E12_01160 [Actinokineospora sp. PR83]|uniref:hypothetical protein n=1 Tax=Actinokineospora sp. PR83 TaxID=2884908 RepID=UPI001F3A7115|nr:hypothetical protein [Actinokineospora sp. PR83]MCG8914405.1 hypothetical protein [Actinokineospora sp. PR83]
MATPDHIPAPRAEFSAARDITEAAVSALTECHPGVAPPTVQAVVVQAAWELAAHAHLPESFRRLLHRRAHARLLAMTGTLLPIRGSRALAAD